MSESGGCRRTKSLYLRDVRMSADPGSMALLCVWLGFARLRERKYINDDDATTVVVLYCRQPRPLS